MISGLIITGSPVSSEEAAEPDSIGDLAELCRKGCRARDQFAVLYTFASENKTQEQVDQGVPLASTGIFARKDNIMYSECVHFYLAPSSQDRIISHHTGVSDGDISVSWSSKGNLGTRMPGMNRSPFLIPTCYSRYIYFVHATPLYEFVDNSLWREINKNEDSSITITRQVKETDQDREKEKVYERTRVTLLPEWGYLPLRLRGYMYGRFTGGFEVKDVFVLNDTEPKRVLPKHIEIDPSKRTGSVYPISIKVVDTVDLSQRDSSILQFDLPEGCLVTDEIQGNEWTVGGKRIESISIGQYPTVSNTLFRKPLDELYRELTDLANSVGIE